MSNAQQIHKEVCGVLLASLESLQEAQLEFSNLLNSPGLGIERMKAKVKVTDCRKKLQQLSDFAKVKNIFGFFYRKVYNIMYYEVYFQKLAVKILFEHLVLCLSYVKNTQSVT